MNQLSLEFDVNRKTNNNVDFTEVLAHLRVLANSENPEIALGAIQEIRKIVELQLAIQNAIKDSPRVPPNVLLRSRIGSEEYEEPSSYDPLLVSGAHP